MWARVTEVHDAGNYALATNSSGEIFFVPIKYYKVNGIEAGDFIDFEPKPAPPFQPVRFVKDGVLYTPPRRTRQRYRVAGSAQIIAKKHIVGANPVPVNTARIHVSAERFRSVQEKLQEEQENEHSSYQRH